MSDKGNAKKKTKYDTKDKKEYEKDRMPKIRNLLIVCLVISESSSEQCKIVDDTEQNCSGLGLTFMPKNLPPNLITIDLSGNNFVRLPKNFFSGYAKLNKIIIHSSGIREIEAGTFHNMSFLESLDLRNNSISSIDHGNFKNIHHLKKLHLDGNPITRLRNGSFDLPDLLDLFLGFCSIAQIELGSFSNLPKLTQLNLNDNQLNTLTEAPFLPLNLTRGLELSNNPWVCDCHLKRLKNWVDARTIHRDKPYNCVEPKRLVGSDWSKINAEELACPSIISHPSQKESLYEIEEYGKDKTFSCNVSLIDDNLKWIWKLSKESDTTDIYNEQGGKYSISNVEGESFLTIKSVDAEDEGTYYCEVKNGGGSDWRSFTIKHLSPHSMMLSRSTIVLLVIASIFVTIMAVSLMAYWRHDKNRPLPDHVIYQPREDLVNQSESVPNPVEKPPRQYEKLPANPSETNSLLYDKIANDDDFDRVSVASVSTTRSRQKAPQPTRYTPDLLTFPQGFSTLYLGNSPCPQTSFVPPTSVIYSPTPRYPTRSDTFDRIGAPTYVPLSRFDSTPTLFNYCPEGPRGSDTASQYSERSLGPVPGPAHHHDYRSLPRGARRPRPLPPPTQHGTMPRTLSAENLIRHNRHASQHPHQGTPRGRYEPPPVLYETDNETYV